VRDLPPRPIRSALPLLAAAALAAGVAGCGEGGGGPALPPLVFDGPPAEALLSTSGQLSVAVRWSPDPPIIGLDAGELTVTDASTGAPAAGLTVSVVPWMPSHGHGSSTTPSVTETSPGVYVATPMSLFMSGQWEIRTTIAGALDDTVTPTLDLQ
jgi:hypothetical protein